MDKIAIVGLGYVGLPLAVEFGKTRHVIGFDINNNRISELEAGFDRTKEVNNDELKQASHLSFTNDKQLLTDATIYIVTVPTPIDEFKKPNLAPLISASQIVSEYLNRGDLVIYESTVYPGCTEEVCVPVLEKGSNLEFNTDFFCGYSPERINPGDKEHRLVNIQKVTSGSTEEAADRVNELYKSIIKVGTYKASSIKVAEASKVIENCQRDLNIAFVNELAIIFNKMGIDTTEVLEAAGTKWNFLPFRPGLVGGHCIGVDPYYLTYKAESIGYRPEVILAGRRINDGMSEYVAKEVIKLMGVKKHSIYDSSIAILGITFKENCPDIRNTKVIDLINEIGEFGARVLVHDPCADSDEVRKVFQIELSQFEDIGECDTVILAVAHDEFLDEKYQLLLKNASIVYDIKSKVNDYTARL